MNNQIKHAGVIESIEGDHAVVRILQTSACAACKVAGHCNASESKEKLVDIYGVKATGLSLSTTGPASRAWETLQVGEAVTITADTAIGYRAVAWGFGIPLVILIVVIFALMVITGNDLLSALCGLAALAPYYILLYFLRDKIRERLSFRIEA